MDEGGQDGEGEGDACPRGIDLTQEGHGRLMPKVSGRIYTPEGFTEGTISFQEGVVEEVSPRRDGDVLAKGLILPCFLNAHTHVADSIVFEEPVGTLEEIVAPPLGLKFRRLQEASGEELVEAMKRTLDRMVLGGTAAFCDFREGGVDGVNALRDALKGSTVGATILGRPTGLNYDRKEVDAILEVADGVGVSSISDWDYGELQKLSRHTRGANKVFSLHASEAQREDIDLVLDLKPSFLVHMTMGSQNDWRRCAEEDVPVVICPRSQVFFGRVPDVPGMQAAGLRLLLGTDNSMFSNPSMLCEMEFAYQVSKLRGGISPEAILNMAYAGAKLLCSPPSITIREGVPSNLLVLDVPTRGNGCYQAIKAMESDIMLLSLGPMVWMRDRGWLEAV